MIVYIEFGNMSRLEVREILNHAIQYVDKWNTRPVEQNYTKAR